ncbi:MAG: hypothetical protein ACREAW_01585, partial [Nitrososphaera sp.]
RIPLLSLPVDFDTFKKLQDQDKIRAEQYAARANLEMRIRERVMLIESYVQFYSQPGYPRADAERLKDLMNKTYNDLLRSVKSISPEDLYHRLVYEDRDLTLEAIIKHFGRHPLPKRLDSPAYQSLHPRTKAQWGIRKVDDHTRF